MPSNIPRRGTWLAAGLALLACALPVPGDSPGMRRALLIGINDYGAGGSRSWRSLEGAVNDVRALREMLVSRYGFELREIVTLTDREATRAAILEAIEEHLVQRSGEGDVVLFHYSGHGSQVRNSLTEEPDGMDESLVPADSRLGAPDLRDKELQRLFNRILDRGARLTVILDSCHSGSGARGLATRARPRSVAPDLRDVADGSKEGPKPEDRGALVLSAAQDFGRAWETRDGEGRPHGAFSLALLHALRHAIPGESAEETFLRARARLQAGERFQEPVLAGGPEARRSPLLGDLAPRRTGRPVVAVELVEADGTVILQGGWANGLTVGSELHLAGSGGEGVALQVTAMSEPGRCEARVLQMRSSKPPSLEPGTLLEISTWTALPGAPLRVWMPRFTGSPEGLLDFAQELARAAPGAGIAWVEDPTRETPSHVLRWWDQGWELLGPGWTSKRLGPSVAAGEALGEIRERPASLFVQLPAPSELIDRIAVGPGTSREGVQPTDREEAAYVLVGRLSGNGLEYAWLRPDTEQTDARSTGLPVRSDWHQLGRETGHALADAVLRLRKIHAWHHLDSPPGGEFAYGLALRRATGGEPVRGGTLAGGEVYGATLQGRTAPLPGDLEPRYVYVFVVDSHGRSVLLFPTGGQVENRFPLSSQRPLPAEIPLGPPALLEVTAPYGMDTYFLLTSADPIPAPWVLEWDGVRTRGPQGKTPLEELLSVTGGASRSPEIRTPATWSIEKVLFESVPGKPLTLPPPHGVSTSRRVSGCRCRKEAQWSFEHGQGRSGPAPSPASLLSFSQAARLRTTVQPRARQGSSSASRRSPTTRPCRRSATRSTTRSTLPISSPWNRSSCRWIGWCCS